MGARGSQGAGPGRVYAGSDPFPRWTQTEEHAPEPPRGAGHAIGEKLLDRPHGQSSARTWFRRSAEARLQQEPTVEASGTRGTCLCARWANSQVWGTPDRSIRLCLVAGLAGCPPHLIPIVSLTGDAKGQ